MKKTVPKKHRFAAKFAGIINDPNYNATPSQDLPVITNRQADRIQLFSWGLVPFWAKEIKGSRRPINARSETLTEKPSFRNLLKLKRCLVLADGFYEWQVTPQGKVTDGLLDIKGKVTGVASSSGRGETECGGTGHTGTSQGGSPPGMSDVP